MSGKYYKFVFPGRDKPTYVCGTSGPTWPFTMQDAYKMGQSVGEIPPGPYEGYELTEHQFVNRYRKTIEVEILDDLSHS